MQAKTWFLTYPRWNADSPTEFNEIMQGITLLLDKEFNREYVAYVIAREKHHDPEDSDESCNLHYHIFLKLDNKIRWNAKTSPHAWDLWGNHPNVQTCRSPDAVVKYCKKEGDYEADGVNLENRAKKRKAYNLEMFTRDPLDLVKEGLVNPAQYLNCVKAQAHYKLHAEPQTHAEGTRGVWIWGEPGVGKSHAARHEYGESIFVKAQNKWWDGYKGETVIILDDLDTPVLNHYLKIWADRWACSGEVKGSTVPLRHETFIVTSNYPIEHFTDGDNAMREALVRRFKVRHLQKMKERM
ncbi:Geminivirus Rep catalytic domain [Carpediemonas membranifera]|uniref:ATP-dependent helicase Rep n=1 Tax=Carpediemonas membranifera TaxID=201153 RepID=A0A8J6ARB2_9EUKA|nr:Geminivirus Rep catalytic domain [Carpediemonas membranifera]|eukprot:KAG9391963.1 Geminivirus Rep catalytic domain [Carpediemonas membranifera]